MFLKKTNVIFFRRVSSLFLVFFISFFIVSYSFVPKKIYANPLVPVIENELAPIIISVLGTLGVTVSLPTAHDFVQQELEKSSEMTKQLAEGTLPIQKLRDKAYYCSKEFINGVVSDWNYYSSSHIGVDNLGWSWFLTPDLDKSGFRWNSSLSTTENFKAIGDIYKKYIGTNYLHCPIGSHVTFYCNGDYYHSVSKYGRYEIVPNGQGFVVYDGNDFFVSLSTNSCPTLIKYKVENEEVNTKVNDSIVKPLTDKQGLYLPMPVVQNVSKILDSPSNSPSSVNIKTTPVGNVNIGNPVDVPADGKVPIDIPSVVGGEQVGALPWSQVFPKPVDGTDSKPVDKPVDGTDSKPVDKPVDGFLGFLQSILDILKQILAWLQGFFDSFLEFLKHLLVPREGYFVDTFNNFKKDLDGKFGIDTGVINNLKDNSNVVEPNFIYKFILLGVPVTLDLSFIKKSVPYCHIFFGGLTAVFLCWFNLKNVLFFIRGTSYIGGTGTGEEKGGK